MSFVNRDMIREPHKSEKNERCNEKARSYIIFPTSISETNGCRPLLVEIKLDPGTVGNELHENMQNENNLLSYGNNSTKLDDNTLTKLKMVFVDKAGTTATSSAATLPCHFFSLPCHFFSDSAFPLCSDFTTPSDPDDSYAANEVTPTQFDAKAHHKIPVETDDCGENIKPCSSEESSCNLPIDFTNNDISRTRYFQNLSGYGASLIKLKREIELIQHIQEHSKVISFELDWRMKQNRRMASNIPFVDREENMMQRLYAKSRTEYRMEGKRRREGIAKKLEERKTDFRTLC